VLRRAAILGREGEHRRPGFGLTELELGPADVALTLELAALDFTDPRGCRYRYRLDGLEERWTITSNASVRYTSLPAGSYSFRAEAANADALWGPPLTLSLTVRPPFHRRAWVRASVGAAVALSLVWAYRVRIARVREIERLRLHIAGELHDEVAGDLAGIAVASERLARSAHVDAEAKAPLEAIREAATRAVEALRDVVWSVEPELDWAAALEQRMRLAAQALLGDRALEFDSRLAEELPLAMAARRDLYLAFKECLHNVVRHSGASRVRVLLEASQGGVAFEVRDDGCGLPAGLGAADLRGLTRRMHRCRGRVEVDQAAEGGARVRCWIPLPRTRDGRRGTWE
jgi:signal transduction histidine kinase